MAFLAAAGPLLTTATAVLGVAGAAQKYRAGQEQSNEIKAQARIEQNAATQREIERRRDLLRALASQNARAGALGVETSGSIGGIIRRDIKDNENDLLVNRYNAAAQYRARMQQASSARRQGNIGAFTSLLDTGMKVYSGLGK